MNLKTLASNIANRIIADGPFTFDQLEERAISKGLDLDTFYEAMELVNKNRRLKISGKKYSRRVVKSEPGSHLTWLRVNYPDVIPGVNDASHPIFDEVDYSWMFLPPDDIREYKYNKRNVYARRKNTTRGAKTLEEGRGSLLAE